MGDQLTANFSGKGMTKNFLELMAMREQFKKCCNSWLTQVTTDNSSTIIFSGLGTSSSPLTALVAISTASGNTLTRNADGLFSSAVSVPVTTANDGLSVLGTTIKLGQTVSQAGNPAALTENREIPLVSSLLQITPGTGLFSIGVPPEFGYNPVVFNVSGNSYLETIILQGSFVSSWTEFAGIATDRTIHIGSGQFGDMIEDLTSVFVLPNFGGYAGAYFTAYVYGNNLAPAPGATSYVVGVSALPVYDNVGASALPIIAGFDSGISTSNGSPVTSGRDFWARELNTVSRLGGTGGVISHYNFYAEACTRATNNFGVYINGVQKNYFGGNVSIGNTVFAASAVLSLTSTTQGFLPPVMTTTQKNAIVSPATGLVVFDSTLGKLCVFSTTWQTITSA